MLFSNGKQLPSNIPRLLTVQGAEIELVASYKYLGIFTDQNLTFKPHIENLVYKLKLKLGFFFRNKYCFSLQVRERLISMTFLPVLDYGDLIFMNAPVQSLKKLDIVYHCALRFMTGSDHRTHHCSLYAAAKHPSLSVRRFTHWMIFIYKCILGLLPPYLCTYMRRTSTHYSLRSQDIIQMQVPRVRTELGKRAFQYSAPACWNDLQKDLRLTDFIGLGEFRSVLKDRERRSIGPCICPK